LFVPAAVPPGGPNEQGSGGLGAGGAVGIGVGSLAALAALLLLLFLKRKKKKPDEEPEATIESEATTTVDEDDMYISEYGLSDGGRPIDEDEDVEDLPQVAASAGDYNSDMQNASEHNPDEEFGDGIFDPDEG
jgi:hypothetical protein